MRPAASFISCNKKKLFQIGPVFEASTHAPQEKTQLCGV